MIDGTYSSTLKQRFEKSDYIIYLDYSTMAQIKGILVRFLKNHGNERPEIPGCKERMNWQFFWWVVKWRKNKRNIIIENLQGICPDKIHIFKTRRQLNKWYKNQFHKRIETSK